MCFVLIARDGVITGGVTYERWGRDDCGSNAELLYSGLVAGGYYADPGSLSNICLPLDPGPEYVYTDEFSKSYLTWIDSAEYRTDNLVFSEQVNNYDVPCAVCHVSRTAKVMIPGRISCPSGWTPEYTGYLMAEHITHSKSANPYCVDGNPEYLIGSEQKQDGVQLYFVGAECGTSFMPCAPYKHLVPLTCVVCTI